VIDGSIAKLEDSYVVGLNALDCRTGENLAREQITSEDKKHVLAALGKGAQELRAQFESDPMVRSMLQRFGGKISEVKRSQEES